MNDNWIGKAVSIHCIGSLGVFQGTIQNVSNQTITIVRAFRNGIPLKKPDMEITITLTDIIKLDLIPAYITTKLDGASNNVVNKPTPIKHPSFNIKQHPESVKSKKQEQKISPPTDSTEKLSKSKSPTVVRPSFASNSMVPAKVETRLGLAALSFDGSSRNVSKPIDINPSRSSVSAFRASDKKSKNRQPNRNSAFTDDGVMDEDFDFEKNLALFDKQAIWDEIDSYQKPDLLRQTPRNGKYRHDENILASEPIRYRRIELAKRFGETENYVTDDGYILPAIPLSLRRKILERAEGCGLSSERQVDSFGRSAAEMALLLVGGSRRMQAKNEHQWPNVVIVCDGNYFARHTEVGLSCGRQLSSQGLKVSVYIRTEHSSTELELFQASGNITTSNCDLLPTPDLIILAIPSMVVSNSTIIKYISDNCRAPVFAIDPPPCGIRDVTIKYSIFPILPIESTNLAACGKLYLCNLSIPDLYYRDCGVEKYKSPFGHKFVIPIHLKDC